MTKAVIIDDERLARKRVLSLLEKHQDKIAVLGEADNGANAIKLIEQEKPTLIFLDIQMPDMSGFEVLEGLSYEPRIIFTTAYQEYAVSAFEQLAVDYLVKPLTVQRFDKAIEKLLLFQPTFEPNQVQQLLNLIQNNAKPKPSFSLPVKKGQKIILMDYEDIAFFKAEDKYVTAQLINGTTHILDKTLIQLEAIVPSNFLRVHRSYIVNKDCIRAVERYFKGTLILTLDDKEQSVIKTGEKHSKQIKRALGI